MLTNLIIVLSKLSKLQKKVGIMYKLPIYNSLDVNIRNFTTILTSLQQEIQKTSISKMSIYLFTEKGKRCRIIPEQNDEDEYWIMQAIDLPYIHIGYPDQTLR